MHVRVRSVKHLVHMAYGVCVCLCVCARDSHENLSLLTTSSLPQDASRQTHICSRGRCLLEVEMHGLYVELLGYHYPSHYSINEQRQEHVS